MTDKKTKKPRKKAQLEAPEIVAVAPYIEQDWRGRIIVYKCVYCGFYTEQKQEIETHCKTHPLSEAEKIALKE